MTITVRIFSYGDLAQEKTFKDADDVEALEWAEEQLADFFAEGLSAEVWFKGRCVWKST